MVLKRMKIQNSKRNKKKKEKTVESSQGDLILPSPEFNMLPSSEQITALETENMCVLLTFTAQSNNENKTMKVLIPILYFVLW